MAKRAGAIIGLLFLAQTAAASFVQQGDKVNGMGAVGPAQQGVSAALSADGSTAIIGGFADNSGLGAAWVGTRIGGAWSHQGDKLVGTGAIGAAQQGYAVAISADGNTAIVGGPGDNASAGAAWVFTRAGGVWSQQGDKLVGTGAVGAVLQGLAVAISADGNTAFVGGPNDDSNTGATWVFNRSGASWTQQGGKLVGTGASGAAVQGAALATSADGNTVFVGGPGDASGVGAAWVFIRRGGVWSQQGGKLVASDAAGAAQCGQSAALSADGNTAIVGGAHDSAKAGAAWVFTRSAGVWSQQGGKLVGTGAVGAARQGVAVAISGDGDAGVVGGWQDNAGAGATWVFTRSGGVWSQQGAKLVGTGGVGATGQGGAVAISSDGATIVVGGPGDDSDAGAIWLFTAPFPIWVPVASHAAGLHNSQWRSDLGLLDTGAVTANVQIRYFASGGVRSNAVSVGPGVQSILTDVVAQLGGSGSGPIEVLSDQPLKVTARTYNQVSADASCYANGTQGQDYPPVGSGDGLATGQIAHLPGLTENLSYHSNIGLVNMGPGAAKVLVELYNGAGAKLAEYTVDLDPGQWAQETQPFKNKASQTAMDRGYAKVTVQSGTGVFAVASVISNVTNDPTTVAMQK